MLEIKWIDLKKFGFETAYLEQLIVIFEYASKTLHNINKLAIDFNKVFVHVLRNVL